MSCRSINITPEQAAWLAVHVARGEFACIDEAARQPIDARIAERMLGDDDQPTREPPELSLGNALAA
ncbi:MAG TPA: hypothetical protein VMU81_28925 [Acetobacteraceae bacterium]|jgi:hypothetical protein|nr:hypothetical protein [Acetobacteraceae bacterium]